MATSNTLDHLLHSSLQAFLLSSYNNNNITTTSKTQHHYDKYEKKKQNNRKSWSRHCRFTQEKPEIREAPLGFPSFSRKANSFICLYISMHIYIQTHIYIHTHTHTFADKLEGSLAELLPGQRLGNGSESLKLLLLLLLLMWLLCFAIAPHLLLLLLKLLLGDKICKLGFLWTTTTTTLGFKSWPSHVPNSPHVWVLQHLWTRLGHLSPFKF